MSTEEKFTAAVNVIRSLPKDGPYQPSHDMMLKFYGLYKQATEGKCEDPKPAFYEVVKGYKWKAWNGLGNMSKNEAMDTYVEELKKVLEKHWNDYSSKISKTVPSSNTWVRLPYSHAPVQDIVETMSYNDNVASFIEALGPFYEYVDIPGLKKESNHITNNNIIKNKIQGDPDYSDESLNSSFDHDDLSNGLPISNGHDIQDNNLLNGDHNYAHTAEEVSDANLEIYSAESVISDDLDSISEYHITNDKVEEILLENSKTKMTNGHIKNLRKKVFSDTESDEEYSEPAEIPDLIQRQKTLEYIEEGSPNTNGIIETNGFDAPHEIDNRPQSVNDSMIKCGGGDSATPGGLQMSVQSTQHKQTGARSSKFGSRNSNYAFGGSPSHSGSGSGGFGGRGNGNGRAPGDATNNEVNAQLVLVLQQIQTDMTSILARLNTLEANSLSVSQCNRSCHCKSPTNVPERSWWPFPELSPRSTFFLLAWPLILHGGIKLLLMLRSRRRHQK